MPDARVQAAIDHWAPRFIQAGVDYNDFARTTARVERWEDWLDAWCETGETHAGLARAAEEAGHPQTAGEAWLRAAVCFHFGKFVWVLDAARSRAPPTARWRRCSPRTGCSTRPPSGSRAPASWPTCGGRLGPGGRRLRC